MADRVVGSGVGNRARDQSSIPGHGSRAFFYR